MMMLYHVIGTLNDYDAYTSFVCAAPSAEVARRTYPYAAAQPRPVWSDAEGRWQDTSGKTARWWGDVWDASIDTVIVVELGIAAPEIEAGVICTNVGLR